MRMSERGRFRRLLAVACLGLYAVGSNYCVLAAGAARTRMACATVAKPAEATSCCHPVAPASAPAERPAATPSCCPAPVIAPPTLALGDESGVPAAHAILADANLTLPVAVTTWHGHRALPDGQPPTRLARAPVPARAPPLA